ncbi:unnamed protein product, partial [Mesorhabditis spiculigera]
MIWELLSRMNNSNSIVSSSSSTSIFSEDGSLAGVEVGVSAISVSLGLFGLFGNSNIIWATWRNKELRNKHGSLMLWFCILHNICLLCELAYVFINNLGLQHRWSSSDCIRLSTPHLIASCAQAVLSLSIALDLLIALLKPFQHRFYALKQYVACFLVPALIYALFTTGWALSQNGRSTAGWCNGPLALSGTVAVWWLWSNVFIVCANVFVYAALYLLISRNSIQADRIRRVYSDDSRPRRCGKTVSTERRVLRSLSVLLAVYLFSWFSYIVGITVILALICHSQNFYVMFVLSNTYRRAFMEQLYILMCKEVPEKYWPMSVTASRRASQNWQKARSEALAVTGGSLHSSVRHHRHLSARRTSSLPDIHRLEASVHSPEVLPKLHTLQVQISVDA